MYSFSRTSHHVSKPNKPHLKTAQFYILYINNKLIINYLISGTNVGPAPSMLKNHFKTAWRSLTQKKGFTIINISGLAVGMAGAVLIFLWLYHEISFDRFHTNKDRLYEVYGLTTVDKQLYAINQTEQPLGPALKREFPEVESTTRLAYTNGFLLTAGDKRFTGIKGSFADPAFFSMFSFPVIRGNKDNPFRNLYSIAITESLSKKLFGQEEALNRTIRIDSTDQFIVTAVLKDLPSNTRFDIEYLLPWDYLKKLGWSTNSWLTNSISTFVLLRPDANLSLFNNKIKDITRRNTGRNDIWTHFLFPLEQWHLYARFENGQPVGGRIEIVRLFGIVAVLILLVACINFMNLSTARSEKRAKEVAVRKVAGAGKGRLIAQFMTEAFLTSFIAGAIALLIVQLTLPYFNVLIDARLSVPYASPGFWACAAGFILLTGLLAGCYPAFYLSAFKPVSIFKGSFKRREGVLSTRKALVVLQFTFAVVLIITTIVVKNQISHAQKRETGYTRNNLVHVSFSGDIDKNYTLIKQDLLNTGIASAVTKTMSPITQRGSNTWGMTWEGKRSDFDETIALFSTDADLVKTAGLQLTAGRDIDIQRYPADSFSVLLNETAVRTMGFKSPIGQIIREPASNKRWHVVGVLKDYVIGSPYEKVPPIIIQGPGSWFNTVHIKFNTAHSTADNLKKAGQVFRKYNPAYPFDYEFIDQEYARNFHAEQRTEMLAALFAALAIFISCLGLFGLSAYIAESRVKEIGVRKVLGASVAGITRLLALDFMKLVMIAIIIASPIAWWMMTQWLNGFAYRISLSWWMFAFAGLLALLIALVTVSFEALKAAMANPVKSLKMD